jgi:hypothetical protein
MRICAADDDINSIRSDCIFSIMLIYSKVRNSAYNALIMGKKLLAKMLRNENSQLFFVLIY